MTDAPTHRKFLSALTLSTLLKGKTRDVVTIDKDATVEQALALLADQDLLSVPVVDEKKADGKVIGILNIQDLATAIAFQETFEQFKATPKKLEELNEEGFDKLLKTSVFSAKVADFIGVSSEGKHTWEYDEKEKLDTVLEIFSKGVHRVIVNTADKKKRIVSQSDVAAFLKANHDKLGEIADKSITDLGLVPKETKLVTMTMYETALTGFQRLWNQGWDLFALPIVDKTGDIVATLSVSDLRGLNKSTFKTLLLPVLDFLRTIKGGARPAISAQPGSSFEEVIQKIVWARVHRVWVLKDHKPVGVISLSDISTKLSPFDYIKPPSS